MLLYAIIFTTSLAGMLGAPWWSAVAGACVLALTLIGQDRREASQAGVDTMIWETAQTASSLMIATIAAPLAFVVGHVTGMLAGL